MLSDRLFTESKNVIILLMDKVIFKLTMNSENTQRKVGDVMGGKVLDLDYINGLVDGREEGREEGIDSSVKKLAEHYMDENPELSMAEALEMAAAILR